MQESTRVYGKLSGIMQECQSWLGVSLPEDQHIFRKWQVANNAAFLVHKGIVTPLTCPYISTGWRVGIDMARHHTNSYTSASLIHFPQFAWAVLSILQLV